MRHALFVARIALMFAAVGAQAQVADYRVEGDGIPKALTSTPGVAARGRALLIKREAANCLQCHAINDKDMHPGGTRGPALDGVGAQLTAAQLRLSVVDYARVSKGTNMPSFHKAGRGQASDKPNLTAQEIEDVVAFLTTLRYR
jgi:sulfur-oxidizing protein SoxX